MRQYSLEQFAAARNYGNFSFSPDGQSVAYVTNTSGQFNIWRQRTYLTPSGQPEMPYQLTALVEESAQEAHWSPDGKRILTFADFQGTENYQLYEIPPNEGWLYPITNEPDVRHELGPFGSEPFSRDGRLVAFSSNARKSTDLDVIVRDLSTGEDRPVFVSEDRNYPATWSSDGRYLLVTRLKQSLDQDVFICDLKTGESRNLTPHDGEVKFIPGPWHPDGTGFYVLTDFEREFTGLAFFSLKDGFLRYVETPQWNVTFVKLSGDGRYLAWVVNQDGYSHLYVKDLRSGSVRDYPDLPVGVYYGLHTSPPGDLLGLYITTPTRPLDLYMLRPQTGEHWKLTQSFLGGIAPSDMVEPELVRFRTFDGLTIPAFLFKPKDMAAGDRVPLVLSIHGGPESQEVPDYAYNGFYQYLLNRNIGVLAPNIRGSVGYGKSYQKLIYRDWGGGDLKDLEAAVQYVRDLDWVDSGRLGLFGGSYGGFATLSCITRIPHYWAAAVDICGPSNLITFAETLPPTWLRRRKGWLGDPQEDAEMLRERSPMRYIENTQAPLLIIQGANDPRVRKSESDQIVERLRSLGRMVEYVVFDDEGHGFSKTANWLKVLKLSAEWLERYLKTLHYNYTEQ